MKRLTIFTSILIMIGFCLNAYAEIPSQMHFQAFLTADDGTPLNGQFTLAIRLYDSAIDGNQLWEENYSIDVEAGFVAIPIGGEENPLDANIFNGSNPVWLAIQVDDDDEMEPRVQIGSVPYATRAAEAENVPSSDEILDLVGSSGYVTEDVLTNYSHTDHLHDDRYYPREEADAQFSDINHRHDSDYAPLIHDHNDLYYTETEVDTLIAGTAASGHTHTWDNITDVPAECAEGEILKWNATAIMWECAVDNDENTIYSALDGGGILFDETAISLLMDCEEGQLLKFDATLNTWECADDIDTDTDTDTTYSARTNFGIKFVGTTIGLIDSCLDNEVLKWDDGNNRWVCAVDESNAGTITGVTAGNGLTGGGTSGAVTLDVEFGGSGAALSAARSDHTHDASGIVSGTLSTGFYSAYSDLASENILDNDADTDLLTRLQADGRYVNSGEANSVSASMIADGASSGLDADLLDGQHGSYYTNADNLGTGTVSTDRYSAVADLTAESLLNNDADTDLLTRLQADGRYVNSGEANSVSASMIADGASSGLDADLLDGQHGSYYTNADNLGAGTVSTDRYSALADLTAENLLNNDAGGDLLTRTQLDGRYVNSGEADSVSASMIADGASSGLDADLLDGQHGSYYTNADNLGAGTVSTDRYSALADLTAENLLNNDAGGDLLTRTQLDGRYVNSGEADSVSASMVADGTGTGLDADLLDGQHGSYYTNADNLGAGTVSTDRYSAVADLTAENLLNNDAGSDLLTRTQLDGRFQAKYVRTVVVSPAATATASGTALINALAGITDAASTKPYLVKIEPGIYALETAQLQLKAYVDLEGSGEGVTTITGYSDFSVIRGAANAEVRWLTIANVGDAAQAEAVGVDNFVGSNISLKHVTIDVSGNSTQCKGIFVHTSSATLKDVTINTHSCSGTSIGVDLQDSSVTLSDVTVSLATSNTSQYGLNVLCSGTEVITIDRMDIDIASTATTTAIGINQNGGTIQANDIDISISDANNGRGFALYSPTVALRDIKVDIADGVTSSYGVYFYNTTDAALDHAEITLTSGGTTARGIYSWLSSGTKARHATLSLDGGTTLEGINNRNSAGGTATMILSNSSVSLANGTTEYGLYQNGSGNLSKMSVDNSQIKATTATIFRDTDAGEVFFGNGKLDGGAVSGSFITCAGVIDENYAFSTGTCP